jgi:histone-lysine N-methyltransferase EZH2
MYITLNLSLKAVLGKSHICEGLGLFTLEDIEKDEFICEYTGEIISRDESDRRSVIKDVVGLNYLFTVSQQFDIDAFRAGNEMR